MENAQLKMEDSHELKIPQEAFDWYDEYAHGDIDRRTFLARLGKLSVAGLTIGMVSSALLPDYALAEQVSFNDETIKASFLEFDSPKGHGKGRGYLVKPTDMKEGEKRPMVLVVHENRGLNPYVKDVARRVAKAGFIAFAPDALFPLGGYPGNDDEGRAMQKSMERAKIEEDFIAAAGFLKKHELSSGKVGVVGFCFGGYISNMLAAVAPDYIDAAVPFYGTPAKEEFRKNIKAPLMLQFGELDKRVNATWPDYEAELKATGKTYEAFVYPGTNHGFHNDSTGRYDEAAAKLAWSRSIDFFKKNLA